MPGPLNCIATYFFAEAGGGTEGWTENWYVQENSLDAALVLAKTYNTGRRRVLSSQWYIEAVRVSDVAVLSDSREAVFRAGETSGSFSGANSEEANVCLFMRLEAGPSRRRLLPLRGIPIGQINPGGTYAPTTAFADAMAKYVKWWTDNAGTLRIRQRSRDAGSPCSIVPLATDTRALQISNAGNTAGLVQGSVIQIANIAQTAAFGYNGNWIVDSVAAGVVITKPKRKKYLLGLATGARMYQLTTTYPAIDAIAPRRGGTRKTGRPFDSSRGRQSATRH